MSNYEINFYEWCFENNNDLMQEWNYEKNKILPTDITPFSNKKVWWKCNKGHEWEASPNNRINGRCCPYCSGKKVMVGYNDLLSQMPELAKEWDYELNGELKPENVTIGSNKKAWWKCEKGHSWQTTINHRSKGTGCPYCSGRNVSTGVNDLETKYPQLAKQWNFEKNGEIKPSEISSHSHKKVWWRCEYGHEWQASVANRSKGRNCPICGSKKVLSGYNDLETKSPELAKQWHPTKNGKLKPTDVLPSSNKKVWWLCEKGHEWQATINNRQKRNCPECSKERQVSFPEKAIFYYVSKTFKDTIENYRPEFLKGKEIDIYIPQLKLGIEYDGEYYHTDSNLDLTKDAICKENDVGLIHIREPKCPLIQEFNSVIYTLKSRNDNEYEKAIEYIFSYIKAEKQLDSKIDLNIDRDRTDIYELMGLSVKRNSIATTHPHLLSEWNYEKNGRILPENISKGSDKKVWWKCEKGHEWDTSVSHRVAGRGCPICSGKRIVSGYNDFMTLYPDLIESWDWEQNTNINPHILGKTSSENAWWKCKKCGGKFQRKIIYQIESRKCPNCKAKV